MLIKGKVKVTYDGGEVEFGAGDMVTFEKGLSCVWQVTEAVEKHYKFV
ncbi:MAG: cupin domain-containing protein [Oscillospiraceae bacterium]|nr:cupin domain-containing protein [Oscillospiraceae bacterium]